MSAQIRTFRIGAPARRGEGLRLGVTRHPPRGIPKSRWQKDSYFDVWFPLVAPSAGLLRKHRPAADAADRVWQKFFAAYQRELRKPPASHAVALLAALATRTPVAIGCYCTDESRCHRSVLREEISRIAAGL